MFIDEHQTWQETQPLLAGRVYPSENTLGQKADETVNAIALLASATSSDRKTNANLLTTVAFLET